MQSGREPRVRPVRVATTREEFNACFASGEAFEASDALAAQIRVFPDYRGRGQQRRVFRTARSERAGG